MMNRVVKQFYEYRSNHGVSKVIKVFLWAFVFVYMWGILNNYDWSFMYVLKQAFMIWLVGFLSFAMAELF